jgi:hypothetical protein
MNSEQEDGGRFRLVRLSIGRFAIASLTAAGMLVVVVLMQAISIQAY